MIILGIHTSLANAEVSVLKDDNIVAKMKEDKPFSQASTIAGLIEKAVACAGVEFSQIDVIGCSIGPGSFTGIRIGLAAARGLGIALEKPLIGVNVFEAVAKSYHDKDITVLIDSKRNDFFAMKYIAGESQGEPFVVANTDDVSLNDKIIFADKEDNISNSVCFVAKYKFENNLNSPAVPMYIRPADVTVCKK